MATFIKLKFEHGAFVPLTPVPLVKTGDTPEFRLPDANIVYLCETDRLAALESGHMIWTEQENEGVDSSNADSHS